MADSRTGAQADRRTVRSPPSRRARAGETLIEFLVVLVLLTAVVVIVGAPLRAARREPASRDGLAELEAAREAKYREIRDAQLDHATGKLSDEDYAALDAMLRAEALEILRAIDRYHQRD